MSKVIKQMEMTSLKNTFKDVRDLVVLSVKGLTCLGDSTLRASLRKKKIRLKVVKNSLTRRVFGELGLNVSPESKYWQGPSVMAWGGSSIAELSQEIDKELKLPKLAALYKDKVKVKGAIADGEEISFEAALKRPTRLEALGRVISLALAPASRIAAQLRGPASRVASQVKTISEKSEPALQTEGAPAEAPAAS
jgi:large subunit ribosomal protein L10